jgi:Family of unknown function (DUF5677)
MNRTAETDLTVLHKYAGAFFRLIEPEFSKGLKLSESDHFGFMALCFTHKQIEHARSLGILIDAQQHSDAAILARVMLEGLIYILWARLEKTDRPLAWRSFSLVSDYESLLKAKARGEHVEEVDEKTLRERLANEATRFLRKNAIKQGAENFLNPYQKYWNVGRDGRRIEISEMVKEVGDPLVKDLYDDLSQLGHWTVRGIGPLLRRNESGIRINFDSSESAAQACAVCIHSLGATARAAAEHFKLPLQSRIDELFAEYLLELGIKADEAQQPHP